MVMSCYREICTGKSSIQNMNLAHAKDDSVYPYARAVEIHRDLFAMLYQSNANELSSFPNFDGEDEEIARR